MPAPKHDQRPGFAILLNSITPYHVNLHRLIAAQIPELKLHALISHGAGDFKWNVSNIPPEINLVRFGREDEHPLENPLRHPLWDWKKGGRIIRHIQQNRVQAVIINGYRFVSYLRVMDYCYRARIPFFVNSDSNIRAEWPLKPHKAFAKRTIYDWWIKRASGVMPMGKLGDEFFAKYGADPNRFYHVPCWPDYDAFAGVDQQQLQRFRRKYRLHDARKYILYLGRLVPDKRVDLLIDAFAEVADDRPDWDLLIVGDGVLRDELHRRVPERLQSRVVWTGFVDGADTIAAYHAAEMLVLPSDMEPWALVVQEAMAAGLVVISSDRPGATYELIEDGKSGRVFPAGDEQELKRALVEVTAADALPRYKQQSRERLAHWREIANPVTEIRRALCDVGVLKSQQAERIDATDAAPTAAR
jgi:glycosyltransferase involved in cell wall biosynthesis